MDAYVAAPARYDSGDGTGMGYRRCGRSGIRLPMVSLGFWQNFGGDRPLETQRAIMQRAFDLGITHFDLANNYGPPVRLGRGQLRADPARGLRALPRRADHLHQGGLGHVARPVRRAAARASTCWRASTSR